MSIAFITLKMVFVLAWTTGDASNLSCQLEYQVHFVYSRMSSGPLTQSKFNTIMRCGTTETVAMELPLRIFGFMPPPSPLPSVALRSDASFFLCTYRVIFWKLSEC
jgi:hypothetical protein